ncbi:MAG TPA: glycosyltransferase 87 family protein, partial [Acidocella sp.]|nr:glycosyltransferase 87 family protein [Acidocella sp.]
IVSACATALALIALSCAALPPDMWVLWGHALPAYQSSYFNSVKALNLNIIVTPAANLVILGLSEKTAWAVQALCGGVMVLVTCWAARRAPYRLAVAITLIAIFLAQPHAYAYDSIAAVAALALGLEAKPRPLMLALGVATYSAPLLLLSPASHWFLYAPLLAACLLAMLALARAARKSAEFGHEPDPVLPAAT